MSLSRLRADFQFTIFAMFCIAAMLGIGPFALYRFAQGQWVAGVVDSLIVLSLAATFVYAWRGGVLEHASLVVVGVTTIGCIAIGLLIGLPGALWSYPAVIANFLLVRRGIALIASALVVIVLVAEGSAFESVPESLMYFASASVCCLFAYVFARRTQEQRAQLELLASRDPLTDASNRRAMERELHIAAEAFRRHRLPVGVLVMDLDHFKRINDAYGHEMGDHVLVEFARLLQARCRAGDRLFRYGGEEFVLLLPGLDREALARLADSLRVAVHEHVRAAGRPVTVSIGGAVLAPGEDNAQWLARADAAMYAAKRGGRDRVVVAEAPDAVGPPAA
ncbi:GGDEF domain-containing protein [Lysobacter humi (ex Lee et al. 2017)]